MTKILRADMAEDSFHKLKGMFGELEANTNDEAIEALMSFYDEYSDKVDQLEDN